MNQRTLIGINRRTLSEFSLLLCFPVWIVPQVRSAESRPNIVFIMADDLGYGDVGCYNSESRISTPNIDRLAADGMRFTDAHAPGSVCVPTRYGLMTGRYPFRRDLKSSRKIEPDRTTIASLLRDNGYATAMVGKWHLGFERRPPDDWSEPLHGGPLDCGFDTYFGIPASLDIPPYYYIRGRQPVVPPTEQIGPKNTPGWTNIQGEFWRAGRIAPGFRHEEVLPKFDEESVAVIDQHRRRNSSKPLFLYVTLTAPHTPWLPTQEFRGKSDVDLYGDFVMQVDSIIGHILDALDRNELTGNTFVIVTSDNGPVWYDRDIQKHSHRATGPLRGMKADVWEGGHRIPFIVRWPNHVPTGSKCNQTICFTDMMATCAEIVGVEPPPDVRQDSFSILPLLYGTTPTKSIRQITIHNRDASAIRIGRWKLIPNHGAGGISKRNQAEVLPDDPRGQL